MKVWAKESGVLMHPTDGWPTPVRKGQLFDADDVLVVAHRHFFEGDVEQATAAPGERRNITRR
jgi:hypothetical protein